MAGARIGDTHSDWWLFAAVGVIVAVALLVVVGFGTLATSASASTLEPCPKPPAAPRFEGEGTLVVANAVKKVLGRNGIRQRLIAPANSFTGRPTYPLKNAGLSGARATVSLGGGFEVGSRNGPATRISSLRLVVKGAARPVITAKVARGRMRLFQVSAAKLKLNAKGGVLNMRGGAARLLPRASMKITGRLGLRKSKRLSPGSKWGRVSVFAARNRKVEDPVAETPVEPPFLGRPDGAAEVASASIKWRVRESFIRYVSVGAGTSVADGATAGPPEQIGPTAALVYSFNFPFTDGWVAPGSEPAAIHGSGKVGFRYCSNTINFTVSDPEIELNGDSDSRLIFRVDGTDGTAFPDSRAVMVQLVPSLATRTTVGNTTTLADIPGYIPQAATGIFADFYPPFPGSVDAPSADLSRFGSLTVSYATTG